MTRYISALMLAGLVATAAPVAGQGTVPPAQGAPPNQAPAPTLLERQDARETRARLQELLRQHPPAVGEILQRDPSLARPDYLAPYPALVAFLQQHPEVGRNPSFFFGDFEYREPRPQDRSYEMFRQVMDSLSVTVVMAAIIGTGIWLIKTFIDHRRWLRVARTQSEVHAKLLDRMANNEDLLSYIQTSAGRRFLESGPIMTDADPARPGSAAPLSRIVLSLQAGVVLTFLGIGFWIAQRSFPDDMSSGFHVIGTLITSIGLGFAASGVLAYFISSRFGLLTTQAPAAHD
jgi:hypothetical protein